MQAKPCARSPGAEALVPQRRTATCCAPPTRCRIAPQAVVVERRAAIMDTGSAQGVMALDPAGLAALKDEGVTRT
jgi:hypothetical protein